MKLDVFIGNDNYLKKERKKYTHRHTFTIIKTNNDLINTVFKTLPNLEVELIVQ